MPLNLTTSGYLEDPPKLANQKPDQLFETDLKPLLATMSPGDVDLRVHCTNTNQRSLPSCVGNSTADSVEILSSIQGHPKVELSRMFVWTLARNMMDVDGDGSGDVNRNTGTYIRLAFQVIHKFGICLEKYWPYDLTKWDKLPSLLAMRKATSRKIKGYYRIHQEGPERIEALLTALRAQHPIVFGTAISKTFSTYDGRSTVSIPTDVNGMHAMVVVGYDSQRGFIIKNSWGSTWGDGGYAYFSEDYMAWSTTKDIWVPTMGHNFK